MPNAFLHQVEVARSLLASSITLGRGVLAVAPGRQPARLFRLYDFEACLYCRNVREALTALHLDAEIFPCPKGGTRFRSEALRIGGKMLFPLLVDPNNDTVMYESADIVAYLFRTYGDRDVPLSYRATPVQPAFGALASGVRGLRGVRARPSREPREQLHLWSFEGSPYSRLVRERLSELEIPYVLHNLGKERWGEIGPPHFRIEGGPYVPEAGGKREAFFQAHGRVQVPYLEDPNTDTKMFESARIIEYLERTYAA
ncbi:glutathione S-transferase N-terminal domain-containing protein [Pendulispora albinea]|uniref:Glutathione S-transferase N-terminal domain-containing protein n=1 Tax=Pendulispora albinea TaxID=2741071 RepID=A0ABZ2M1A3_9BACT